MPRFWNIGHLMLFSLDAIDSASLLTLQVIV